MLNVSQNPWISCLGGASHGRVARSLAKVNLLSATQDSSFSTMQLCSLLLSMPVRNWTVGTVSNMDTRTDRTEDGLIRMTHLYEVLVTGHISPGRSAFVFDASWIFRKEQSVWLPLSQEDRQGSILVAGCRPHCDLKRRQAQVLQSK